MSLKYSHVILNKKIHAKKRGGEAVEFKEGVVTLVSGKKLRAEKKVRQKRFAEFIRREAKSPQEAVAIASVFPVDAACRVLFWPEL